MALETDFLAAVATGAEHDGAVEGLGSVIDFDPHDEDGLPSVAGVYVFYDMSERPVYVGLAQKPSIRDRVREDYEKSWFKKPIVDRASYIEIKDESLCAQIGQILVRVLKPNAVLTQRLVDLRSEAPDSSNCRPEAS